MKYFSDIFLGRLALLASLVGVFFLIFVLGGASVHYRWPVVKPLLEAFEGGQAWSDQKKIARRVSKDTLKRVEMVKPKVLLWDKKQANNGYTLMTMLNSTTAYLVDMEGKIVHTWSLPFDKAWPEHPHIERIAAGVRMYYRNAYAYPNGDLLAVYEGRGDTPYGYGLAKMDKDSNLIWALNERAHHDVYVQHATGNIYALTHRIEREPVEGLEKIEYPTLMDYVVVLSAQGKKLSELSLLEAFIDTPYEPLLNITLGKKTWDFTHVNSVTVLEPEMAKYFPMFKAGDILISMRNISVLAVIRPETKKVVWAARGSWGGQHSATFTDKGTILFFDNAIRTQNVITMSRVVELNPKTLRLEDIYGNRIDQPMASAVFGEAQRLDNGNTLVTVSDQRRMLEISAGGRIAWALSIDKPRKKRRKERLLAQINDAAEQQSKAEQGENKNVGERYFVPPSILSAHRYSLGELRFLEGSKDNK